MNYSIKASMKQESYCFFILVLKLDRLAYWLQNIFDGACNEIRIALTICITIFSNSVYNFCAD